MANLRRWLVSLCTRRKAGATQEEWKNIRMSFSQFGEDLVLEHLLPPKGFYIDIGANHPVTHSNTWLFYRNGWRGITVEPNPDLARLHRQRRPKDRVIEAAVGKKDGWGTLQRGDSHLTNHVEICRHGQKSKKSGSVRILTLSRILLENLPAETEVDLLNVDCEGMDLQILQGHDWKRCRPKVICAEAKTPGEERKLKALLQRRGYAMQARIFYSVIFVRKDWLEKCLPGLPETG